MQYACEGGTLRVDAILVPAILDKRSRVATRYRGALRGIRGLLRGADALRLVMTPMPRSLIRMAGGGYGLPLRVDDAAAGAASEIHALRLHAAPEASPAHWPDALPTEPEGRLVQLFVDRRVSAVIL